MPTILLIEDERSIADAVMVALEQDGMQVHWSQTLGDGLAYFENQRIDTVILDIGLPDGHGFDACRSIRQQSEVPILFLSARDAEVDRITGLELGADDYIIKPFSPRELSARVRANLRRQSASSNASAPAAAIELGPLLAEPARRRICFGSEDLCLSAQQYRLLLCLLQEPGRVFSRQELMRAAWDDPDMSEARTVDSHIRDLRAILRKVMPSPAEIIRTHRGSGYSIKDDW